MLPHACIITLDNASAVKRAHLLRHGLSLLLNILLPCAQGPSVHATLLDFAHREGIDIMILGAAAAVSAVRNRITCTQKNLARQT